jgi:hypothetical protein
MGGLPDCFFMYGGPPWLLLHVWGFSLTASSCMGGLPDCFCACYHSWIRYHCSFYFFFKFSTFLLSVVQAVHIDLWRPRRYPEYAFAVLSLVTPPLQRFTFIGLLIGGGMEQSLSPVCATEPFLWWVNLNRHFKTLQVIIVRTYHRRQS